MSRFEELLSPLSQDAQQTVMGLLGALTDADNPLTSEEFLEAATSVIAGTRQRARLLALAILRETLEDALGHGYLISTEVSLAVVETRESTARLTGVLSGILTGDPDARPTRLSRLAGAEPFFAAQEITQTALVAEDAVTGWVRERESGDCELCSWWARGGRVWPPDHRMPTHKGCRCRQRPVTA